VIARSLEVPYETVRSWIRAEGEKAIKKIETRKKKQINKSFKKAGIDGMWSYVRKKENDIWIWTAVFDRDTKFFEIGKRDEETFWKFYYQIPLAEEFQTDGYKAYEGLDNRKIGKYGCTNQKEYGL
jgi:hypothetical protein